MNKKNINVLIIDDNRIIGQCVRKRIIRANMGNFSNPFYNVKPHFFEVETKDKPSEDDIGFISYQIQETIKKNEITFLLLDRGLFKIIDPSASTDNMFDESQKGNLFCTENWKDSMIMVEDILKRIENEILSRISGVIVYTYDMENDKDLFVEQEELRHNLLDNVFNKLTLSDIDVLLTNSEIYKLAELTLYIDEKKDDLIILGKKSDFKLYGLFVGEILYNRLCNMLMHKDVWKDMKDMT